MKTTLVRWFDSDVGYSFRTSPVAMIAAAIALITTTNSFSGVVAPLLVAKVREASGGFTVSLLILASGLVLAAALFHVVLGRNAKRPA